MTRKELAIELAKIKKAKLGLNASIEKLAKGFLNGCGYMKPYTKEELINAIESEK